MRSTTEGTESTEESLEKAHAFVESPELRDTMKNAGVAETPDVSYLEEVAHATV